MASSWGTSWDTSWLNSWGPMGNPAGTPNPWDAFRRRKNVGIILRRFPPKSLRALKHHKR